MPSSPARIGSGPAMEHALARRSPLSDLHRSGEALFAPYGPSDEAVGAAIELVEAFDPVEVEYASIRRSAAVFDQPHRATLEVTGSDRLEFLNRMLTQELKGIEPFSQRRAFWLNRKGRIDADLRLINLPNRVLVDVDVHAAERARTGLESFVITEDVAVADVTDAHHRMALHGPGAASLLARLSEAGSGQGALIAEIQPGQASMIRIAGVEAVVDRHDTAGEIGLQMLVPSGGAVAVYEAISTPWSARGPAGAAVTPSTELARRIGWHAVNIARIEAGTALYYADFGPDSLPHETGRETLSDRVSFKKGCYLGQEVVARMQSLGHPKQQLCALRIEAPKLSNPSDRFGQAVTGTGVLDADSPEAKTVGAVTSSCVSPMLGQAPICLAMVKWSHSTPGTRVWLAADGARLPATVQESMVFWKP